MRSTVRISWVFVSLDLAVVRRGPVDPQGLVLEIDVHRLEGEALAGPKPRLHQHSEERVVAAVRRGLREEERNGAFFRLVQLTTNAPPGKAATGGTRHGKGCQQVGRSA